MPRKNSKVMTDPGIAKIGKAPKGKRKELFDALAPGLCLRVTETGAKTWSCYYRLLGTNKRQTIGPWPAVSVAEARDRAREVKEQARAGVDPKAIVDVARNAAKAEAESATRTTFGFIAERYIARECERLKRGASYASVIRRELLPAWKDRQMSELRRGDLAAITDTIIDSDRPAAAHRVSEITKTIFNWATDRGDIEFSPFAAMRPPVQKKARDRVLKDDEIKTLWSVWGQMGYPFGDVQKLLLLLGQRRSEVAEIQWPEIDLEVRTWIIPAGRSKSQREHLVPLPDAAVEIIKALPRFNAGAFVFSTRSGKLPVAGFSRAKARTDLLTVATINGLAAEQVSRLPQRAITELPTIEDWRLHDLRRTARTGLARLGVAEIVSERIINHEIQGLVKIYNLHEYQDEKRAGLERWTAEVMSIVSPPPPNVVPIRKAKSA